MFRAMNKVTGEDIVSLNFHRHEIEPLRELGHARQLVCPHCRLDVLVKAGEIKVQHFAHWVNEKKCPASGSAQLMLARATLYQWLKERFRDKGTVRIEHVPQGVPVHRPIDCWVEMEHESLAFWIFEKGINSPKTDVLKYGLGPNVSLVPVFLASLLERSNNDLVPRFARESIKLSTTETRFLTKSRYDDPHIERYTNGSIHYLDAVADPPTLTTFRALYNVGTGGYWMGNEITSPFGSVRFILSEKQFVHPDEHDEWFKWSERQREEKEQREAKEIAMSGRPWHPPVAPPVHQTPPTTEEREGTCRGCFKKTRDWITYDGATQTCWCRECYYPRET